MEEMTDEEQSNRFDRKNIIKVMRRVKVSSIFSLFVALFLGILTTRDIIPIPFIHFENMLPDTMPPIEETLWRDSIKGFLLYNLSAFVTYFFPSLAISYYAYGKLFNTADEEIIHKRGTKRVEAKDLKARIEKAIKEKGDEATFIFGQQEIPIPSKEVPRNFLFLGKVGSGKTQAIFNEIFGGYHMVNGLPVKTSKGIVDMNCTMIVYDRKPDFTQLLYRRGSGKDFLFDPRDKDSLRWNIFDDLKPGEEIDETMVDFFAQAIVPSDPDSKSAHFIDQAQAVMKAILIKIAGMKNPSNKVLIDFLQANGEGLQLRNVLSVDKTVIKYGLQGGVLNALTLGVGGLDSQGNSVMASINKAIRGLCRREFYYDEGNFSVRWFINTIDQFPDRRLFIVNTKEMAGAYTTYFSQLILLIFKIGTTLSQPSDRRIFMLFDEVQSLGSDGNHALGKKIIEELGNFMGESRSYGYSVTVATQSLPQLEKLVKKEGMRELFQHLSTKVLLQYNEPDGAEFLSRFLNEMEIRRIKQSHSQGASAATDVSQDRLQESDEEKLKRIVLPGEFNTLKPLEAFLIVGEHPVAKINFTYRQPDLITEGLIPRKLPDLDHETILKMRRFYSNLADEEQIREQLIKQKNQKALEEKLKASMNQNP
ncbi:MAG: type IV secretion system DNA-binding domain-containing protein [Sulfuricurvum sp.]|jgi:type IV secretory pathway TraG/TraD family ATPase VirD4|uniref:type IV secretory system conjugative DNA transfer family protein n=1 Tax=Sulfuricurvum sp. TaxID=2025608 RepID=UPI0025D4E1ED|nr:type IV secretion system DNA-binding domain-containing protein [Sulfuricurvum sp.]MCK9372431.1 type IV secretion system DNA-binding domain-containing protein [Sulfuricurvum sp.]